MNWISTAALGPRSGWKIVDPELALKFDVAETICPHGGGARNWPATALNPDTHLLYVPMIESCTDFIRRTRTPAEVAAGAVDIGFVLKARPHSDGNFGRFEAIDLAARNVLWIQRRRIPHRSRTASPASNTWRWWRAAADRTTPPGRVSPPRSTIRPARAPVPVPA